MMIIFSGGGAERDLLLLPHHHKASLLVQVAQKGQQLDGQQKGPPQWTVDRMADTTSQAYQITRQKIPAFFCVLI